MSGAKFDKNKPHGTIHGDTDGRCFEQDGVIFDAQGNEFVAPVAAPTETEAEVEARVEAEVKKRLDSAVQAAIGPAVQAAVAAAMAEAKAAPAVAAPAAPAKAK